MSWTPGSVPGALVQLKLAAPDGDQIRCSASDGDGTLTVSQTLLGVEPSAGRGGIELTRVVAQTTTAGDLALSLTSQTSLQDTPEFAP